MTAIDPTRLAQAVLSPGDAFSFLRAGSGKEFATHVATFVADLIAGTHGSLRDYFVPSCSYDADNAVHVYTLTATPAFCKKLSNHIISERFKDDPAGATAAFETYRTSAQREFAAFARAPQTGVLRATLSMGDPTDGDSFAMQSVSVSYETETPPARAAKGVRLA